MNAISSWLCSNSSKHLFVKIVHPGGHVELHDRPILASELLERNPKCCVAHPNVFQQPYAIVSPETTLLLGKKYYVVPLGTIRKLQLKHPRSLDGQNHHEDTDSSSVCWLFRHDSKNGSSKNVRTMSLGIKVRANSSNSLSDDGTKNGRNTKKRGRIGKPPPSTSASASASSSPGRISLVSMV